MKQDIKKFKTDRGEITWITLTNRSGASVTLSSWGAGIVALCVPDRCGNKANVVLNYPRPEDYFDDGPCAGKTPGRYANRIGGGRLELDGVVYQLDVNNGPNHLHGGLEGFQNRNWECIPGDDVSTVAFKLKSPDGDQHYPGELTATVTYRWSESLNRLTIEYIAFVSGHPTVINLTNHTYWNLSGFQTSDILGHKLRLPSKRYLATDDSLCPTGEIVPVKGTPMDFTAECAVGQRLHDDYTALRQGKGYDALWIIDNNTGRPVIAAELYDPASGRLLTVTSDQPGVQIYTGNWLSGCPDGPDGRKYADYSAVAIECQGYPDAPNHPDFPSQRLDTLDNDDIYNHTIEYTFTTK